MKKGILSIICVATLVFVLSLGLFPQTVQANEPEDLAYDSEPCYPVELYRKMNSPGCITFAWDCRWGCPN